MSRPHGRRAATEPTWYLRVPFMLAVAALVSCLLSAIERPPTRARSGPEAVRVQGVDAELARELRHGLTELGRRAARLRRSLAMLPDEATASAETHQQARRRWSAELTAFDDRIAGWERWPLLRLGGQVTLADVGASLRGWPDTTASGLDLLELDPLHDRDLLDARLDAVVRSTRGLAGALIRSSR